MSNKIIILITIILLISQLNINSTISKSLEDDISIDNIKLENNILDKNFSIIENFPYVSQETNFYCTYACPTMIIKYFGINTSLYEVMFNSGVGYSLI